jgi:hypothetical protein
MAMTMLLSWVKLPVYPAMTAAFRPLWEYSEKDLRIRKIELNLEHFIRHAPVTGIPGVVSRVVRYHNGDAETVWVVPGYRCPECHRTFFVADWLDLKHECCYE